MPVADRPVSWASSMSRVIALRAWIERGRRHPLLGPLLIILLVLVLVLIAMHEGGESVAGHSGEFCVALALVLMAIAVYGQPPLRRVLMGLVASRAPPTVRPNRNSIARHLAVTTLSPLRL